jgi:aminopeptidase N
MVSVNPASAVDLSQWKEYFLAHEIAHQWWGQGVTWARYRDNWISEGLAQYSSVLFLQFKYGPEAFSAILKKLSRWTEKKAKWGPIILGSRLSFIDFQAYQAIVYNKTALVLNMLHDLLGEDVFLAGLKQFFRQYKFGAAATGQFIKVMENVSGRELGGFFSPWFETHLLPDIRVTYRTEARTSGHVLKVRVEQKNGVFVFPLWFEWQGRDGRRGRQKVIIESSSQDFDLLLPAAPRKVKVNPDEAVPGDFSFNKG